MPLPAKSGESQSALYVFQSSGVAYPLQGEISWAPALHLQVLLTVPTTVFPHLVHLAPLLKKSEGYVGGLMGSWKVPGLSHWRWETCCFLLSMWCWATSSGIPSVKQIPNLSHLEGLLWGRMGWTHEPPLPSHSPPPTDSLPTWNGLERWDGISLAAWLSYIRHGRTMDYSLYAFLPRPIHSRASDYPSNWMKCTSLPEHGTSVTSPSCIQSRSHNIHL